MRPSTYPKVFSNSLKILTYSQDVKIFYTLVNNFRPCEHSPVKYHSIILWSHDFQIIYYFSTSIIGEISKQTSWMGNASSDNKLSH